METGDMRQIITFQMPVAGKTPAGQPNTGWESISTRPTMWAAFIADKGSEGVSSEKKTAVRRGTWKVHYRTDLTEKMTIVADGKRWDIDNIRELVPGRGLMIHASWTEGQYDE